MEHAEEVANDCAKCADEYEQRPGMAGSLTMIDLYRAIARLARIVEAQSNEIAALRRSSPINPHL